MFIDPFYYIQRSFIDNDEAEYLVDILNNNSNNKLKASIENGSDYNIRSTNVYFMPDEIYSDFNNMFYTYCLNINNLLGWNFDITNTETVQLLEYKQGDFYKCTNCGGTNITIWDTKLKPCPKCGGEMKKDTLRGMILWD